MEDSSRRHAQERGLLVYDGDCGFCRRWVRHMESWFDQHPEAVAWQQADLAALGLTADRCREAVQFVDSDLRVSSGSDAAARVLLVAGFPYSVAGAIMLAPGVRTLAQAVYRWVAANRHRFKGDPVAP